MCHFLRNRTPCHLVPPRLPMAPSRPCLGGAAGPVFGAGLGSVFWGRILAPVLGPKVVAHTVCATGSAPKTGPRFRPQKTDPIFMPMDRAGRRQRSGRGIRPRGGGHGASAGGPFPSEAGPQTERLLLPPSPPGELAEPGCRGGLPPPSQGGPLRALGDPARRGRSLHLASRRQESKLLQRGPCNADVGRGTARSLKNGSPQGRREEGVYPTVR